MFEHLLKGKKIKRADIQKKLLAFYELLINGRIPGAPSNISAILACYEESMWEDLNSEGVFYNNNILVIFAYVFSIRLELFYIGKSGQLSCQYFGLKKKPIRRIFMSEGSYCLLKKSLPVTNTFSTKICSDAEYNNQDYTIVENRRLKEEHWNKKNNRHDCMFKLKTPAYKSRKPKRIDDELDSMDSFMERRNTGAGICDIIEEVLSSLEHSKDNYYSKDIANAVSREGDKAKNTELDTEEVLDAWARDIILNRKLSDPLVEEPVLNQPEQLKDGDVAAGITHSSINGMLKFYSEVKEYGFILMDDGSEVFIHKADLVKQNIDTRHLAYYRKFYNIFVKFDIEEYQGKTKKHRKAVNMIILDMTSII